MSELTLEQVGNSGERGLADHSWSHYAHLSIYHFAVPYTRGKRVLDAGSGSGYGTAYLAKHGADVLGLDGSADAVAHSNATYTQAAFSLVDLNEPLPLDTGAFEVVFSSNVFEHVANIDSLVAECGRVMKPGGLAIIAVPPIVSELSMEADMRNPFHVHHFPPIAWQRKLERFFESVECRRHIGLGAYATEESHREQMTKWPADVTIRETDFEFPPIDAAEIIADHCLTAVFLCREPRASPLPESIMERTPAAWCEGAVAAQLIGAASREGAEQQRIIAELSAHLEAQRVELEQARASRSEAMASLEATQLQIEVVLAEAALLKSSNSWRMTSPLRALRRYSSR